MPPRGRGRAQASRRTLRRRFQRPTSQRSLRRRPTNPATDKKTIKSSYRQLARKFHPDVNKEADAEQRFKDISAAYEVLSDDEKRQIYDRFAEQGLKGGFGGAGAGMGGMGGMGGDFRCGLGVESPSGAAACM